MTISRKLILGFLLVATLASLTTYFTIGSYQNISDVFETMTKDPLPAIKALEGIQHGGIRIVASTSEFGFIQSEKSKAESGSLENEEENLVESGRRSYDESLSEYEALVSDASRDDLEYFEKIKDAGDALLKTSREIIEMKKAGVSGDEVLEKKEEFEQTEQAFLLLVEEAKQKEYEELAEEQERVATTISVSTKRTLFVTVLTFVLAIVSGIYISRLISRRIIELKKASQMVSRGELDTYINTESSDEVGDLARSFNRMVGDLKESRTDLLSAKNFVDNIIGSMADMLFVTDLQGVITRFNASAVVLTGYREEELINRPVSLINGDEALLSENSLIELRKTGAISNVEKHIQTKDGKLIPVSLSASVLRDTKGRRIGFVCVAQDISERKRLETALTHQALHDPLTGLANRLLFHNRVEHALALAARQQMPMAVLFLDLDNFKNVNDSLGHAAGDELLKEVAQRIGNCSRTSDTAARLGGDEFALLLEQLTDPDYAISVVDRIFETLRDPFLINGKEIFIQASIGIAVTETALENPEDLLRNADVAMYMAKSQGKGRYTFFETRMHERLIERLEMEADLRCAIENEEFTLHYQPIINFGSGQIQGMEALVRWNHPTRGMVMPLDFIPITEETGLIVPIGCWILERACRQAVTWQREFPEKQPLSMTVNLSGRQFQHPQLVDMVADVLAKSELQPELLVLEITESMMLQNTEVMIDKLHQLKSLGVRLAIDDFGTGYSSLSYLHRFPIDTIKIDKSFVDKIGKDLEEEAVARAIIMMSDSLSMRTIAEGIENSEQSKILKDMGCELGQGYYFAKPLQEHDFAELLAKSPGPNFVEVDQSVQILTPRLSENVKASAPIG